MRIACLQFAPVVGDIDNNLSRADAVLSRARPEHLDLMVLPELAFSGNSALAFDYMISSTNDEQDTISSLSTIFRLTLSPQHPGSHLYGRGRLL